MSKKIIVYDLNGHEPRKSYAKMEAAIKSLGEASKVMESSWIVDSCLTPGEIYTRLSGCVDNNDGLLIASVDLSTAVYVRGSRSVF